MAKELTVGTETFEYPENGETVGVWGEEATAWSEAVTKLLGTLQGSNDIPVTSFSFLDNISTPSNILGMAFNTSSGGVLGVKVEYVVERVYNSGSSVLVESGTIIGNFDGSIFSISQEVVGNAEITISVTNAGQFQYTSSALTNPTTNVIKFKASALDQ